MEEDQGVAGLVGAGFGIAVVPKMPILSYMPVSIIEIATPSWERLFYMATLKNVYQAPVVMNFKSMLLNMPKYNACQMQINSRYTAHRIYDS